ncbi:phospholipase D alpha 4 isoform X3 [Magnolia sinica]|uniref:phospholipase D alpha 4 isoform X3 n=1 Tax=Magnolia sinica TaxID=86752 RepID=UPI002657CACA|nr:phospholipase D alpha 4 isoform X3 [Magnolia sinica]
MYSHNFSNVSLVMERNFFKFLHGTLEASIFYATAYDPSSPCSCICVGEKPSYVTIKLNETKVAETTHELDRTWNQSFQILCAHSSDSTMIVITLRTRFSILGKIHIPAHQLLNNASLHDGFFPLLTEKGKPIPKLKLRFRLGFKHAESDRHWGRGFAHGTFLGITSGVTFHQRSNCAVTLYQDAHHRPCFQPPLHMDGGQMYQSRKLWEDIYKAMDGTKHLIYIAGWSLNPKIVLVRDPETEIPQAKGVTIGELLKRKAEEGVAVRIMLWDDETSLPIIKNKGVMRTHDQDAFDYFKHSKVVCRLCPRMHHKFPTSFAHHQKTITVDIQSSIGHREIMSFVGGLDLCDGRYDTEEHSLFRTLNTESHADDFYQINFDGASLHRGGPREPWHDTHASITGQAAWDVLINFEQRWMKQCEPCLLLSTDEISDLIQPSIMVGHDYNWKVQVFRSIDHISARPLLDDVCVAECSIHAAYVEAIRRAERFVYIENQYFIGGCNMWEKDQRCRCKNLIPVEIALKLASKIRSRERFAVYIVIPMWPEGVPESESVQDILHWTRLTMSMMYRLIGEAIGETGVGVHPMDYLNFFCLANREKVVRGEFIPPSSPQHTSQYWRAQMHRRFMIYVHSKLMIGSANVNQRSMDGRRDTEIAIGCYQPDFTGERRDSSDVHKYRMSLWYEHTRRIEQVFLEPESVECVRRMVGIGEETWMAYSGEDVVDMEGVHLVNYPVRVTKEGCIEEIGEDGGTFPDTTALVRGKRSKLLPPIFTT